MGSLPPQPKKPPALLFEALFRLVVYFLAVIAAPAAFTSDINHFFDVGSRIGWAQWPYRDIAWEFPPLTVPFLSMAAVLGGMRETYVALFVTMMMALEFASLALLRDARRHAATGITWFWTLTVVPLGAVAYFRLDFLSMLFASIALSAVLRERRAAAAIVFGFAAKVWPAVYVGALLGSRRYAQAATAAAGIFGVCALWFAFSPSGFTSFLEFRRGAGFQIESIPGSLLLLAGRPPAFEFGAAVVSDAGLEWVHSLLFVCLTGGSACLIGVVWAKGGDAIALAAALTSIVIVTSRIISPQYLVWLAPPVALLWPERRLQGWLFGAAVLCTLAELVAYESMLRGAIVPVLLVVFRNVTLVALTVELSRISTTSSASPHTLATHAQDC